MAPVLPQDLLLETADVRRELGDASQRDVDRLVSSGELEPTIVTRSGRRLFSRYDVERVKRRRRASRQRKGAA